ncbi:MAG: poly(3-hydroxyalkanoate) polymerase, partial [Actinomycetota bacterium]|nr:poly(3-hydroxyalkanoate) polymerase [Actinomycetota bacterium]
MDLGTPCAALRAAAALAVRPGAVLRRGAGLAAELGMVGIGTSTVAPHDGDERFAGRIEDPVRR